MYKTILVPVDITEPELTQQVIPHVNALARLEDSHVHFLAVIRRAPPTRPSALPPPRR